MEGLLMTLNKLRREVRRLSQRASRAKTRLNRFRLKLALEGHDGSMQTTNTWPSYQLWYLGHAAKIHAQNLHAARLKSKRAKSKEGA